MTRFLYSPEKAILYIPWMDIGRKNFIQETRTLFSHPDATTLHILQRQQTFRRENCLRGGL